MQLNTLLTAMFRNAGLPVPAPMPPTVQEPPVDTTEDDEDDDDRSIDDETLFVNGECDIDGNRDSDAEDMQFARSYSGRDCPIFDMSDGYYDGDF